MIWDEGLLFVGVSVGEMVIPTALKKKSTELRTNWIIKLLRVQPLLCSKLVVLLIFVDL